MPATNKNTDKLKKALQSGKSALRAIINDVGGAITDSTPFADYVEQFKLHKISAYVISAVSGLGTTLSGTIATKVDKTSSANKVYGTDGSGNQKLYDVDNYPNAEGSIARRSAQAGHVGQIQVPVTPIANGEASSKQYVDKSTAKSLVISMDNSTYVITFTLKDGNNNTLSTQSVDLPLESTVVSGSYDDDTQSLVLTLKSGSTITIPIDDLIDGLVSSTDLSTTLANYYTKTEADNEFVDKTSTETITGTKTFQGDLKFQGSGTNTVGQITTTNYSVKLGYGGSNYISIDGNSFYTMVADYDLGSSSKKWRDVYVSRNLTDGTNAITVANILAKADKTYVDSQDNAILYALNNLRSMFYETTVDVETMLENYLSFKALPLTLSSKNIIFSGGMDLLNIKGNSFAYNQQAKELNSTNWQEYSYTTSKSFSSGVATFDKGSGQSYGDISSTFETLNSGTKVLISFQVKATNTLPTSFQCLIRGTGTNQSEGFQSSITTSFKTMYYFLTITDTKNRIQFMTNEEVQMQNIQLFNLTQSGITASDVAEAKAELLKRGVNVDEYNPYNVGQIRNSQPTKLISRGFNIWDEVLEVGALDISTGQNTSNSSTRRSENYIDVKGGVTYYANAPVANDIFALFYDKDKNLIKGINGSYNYILIGQSTFTPPTSAKYMRFYTGQNHLTNICFNISNASLNGTYKPYVAPDEKTLTLPALRSAGTVQDDCVNVNVGEVDLSTLTFTNPSGTIWVASGVPVKKPINNNTSVIAICSKYIVDSYTNIYTNNTTGLCVSSGGGDIIINDASITSASQINGILNYELATPTPQSPAITLPQDIKIYAGGRIEVEYDSTNSCPSDFEFEVATSKIVEE